MTKGEATCQEFCEEVLASDKKHHHEFEDQKGWVKREELKCRVDIKYFSPLMERMIGIGYCCTQVQKDLKGHLCTIWFEPRSDF